MDANPNPTRGERQETTGPQTTEWLGQAAERLIRPYAALLADRIDAAAAGLREAAQRIAPEEQSAVADGLRRTAEQGEAVAASARHEPVERLVDQAADFARAQPALFLGATAAAGWALGLALHSQRASQPQHGGDGSSATGETPQPPYEAQEQTKQ